MGAVLALWHDLAPEGEALFPRWYNHQHLFERVAVPGFRYGQRYQAVAAQRGYFCFYAVEDAAVLASPAYCERLDNPTDWTRAIMPHFRAMLRTVCEETHCLGGLLGSHAVVWRCAAPPQAQPALLAALAARAEVARVRLWRAAETQTPVNAEAALRQGDALIGGALVVECAGAAAAEAVAALDVSAIVGHATAEHYALLAARYP